MKANIEKVKEVLEKKLMIPFYQRPYRWTEKNVLNLLEDIFANYIMNKASYRIGSLILYYYNEQFDIVDGLQRITTLLLAFKALNSQHGVELRKRLRYQHKDSIYNIVNSYRFISAWITEKLTGENKNRFADYMASNCEFVVISVNDITEAFQMFDSQNTRGKELEPYNLIKAYHIRFMAQESQETKVKLDQKWEEATFFKKDAKDELEPPKDLLKQLFNEQLYRTRKWSKKTAAYRFNKSEIDEFKGSNILQNNIKFPYQNIFLLQQVAQSFLEKNKFDLKGIKKRISIIDSEVINPFVQINQRIINGKNFFEYVLTYIELYKMLFENNFDEGTSLAEFKNFYQRHCFYPGFFRSGDSYLREVYKSAIFLLFDRFGEPGLGKFYKTIFSLIYSKRIEKFQIRYKSLAKDEEIMEIFWIIENSKDFFDLVSLEQIEKKYMIQFLNQQNRRMVKGIEVVVNFFEDRYKHEKNE